MTVTRKQIAKLITFFVTAMLCVVTLTGCLPALPWFAPQEDGGIGAQNGDSSVSGEFEEFDELSMDIFRYFTASETVKLNYTLAHPENFDIERPEPTFGEYTEDAFDESRTEISGFLTRLQAIDRSKLDTERKFTYDILEDVFTSELNSKEYDYYGSSISPTIGVFRPRCRYCLRNIISMKSVTSKNIWNC